MQNRRFRSYREYPRTNRPANVEYYQIMLAFEANGHSREKAEELEKTINYMFELDGKMEFWTRKRVPSPRSEDNIEDIFVYTANGMEDKLDDVMDLLQWNEYLHWFQIVGRGN